MIHIFYWAWIGLFTYIGVFLASSNITYFPFIFLPAIPAFWYWIMVFLPHKKPVTKVIIVKKKD